LAGGGFRMIRVRHTITEEERGALARVRKLLKLSQEDLAERMGGGIEQNWISQTLSGKRKVREIDAVESLARTLLGLFEKKRSSLDIDFDLAETLTITLQRLAYLSSPSKIPLTLLITPPGRPVPAGAANYVEREADEKLDDCLKRQDFSITVPGPVQSGRTSLMLKLVDEAIKRHFVTDYFSVKDIIWNDTKLTKLEGHDRADIFIQWLKQRLANNWRLHYSKEDEKIEFASWLEKQLPPDPSRRFLLVVDDLTAFGDRVAMSILSKLRPAKTRAPSFSVALGLSNIGRTALASSMYFQERVEVEWFDDKQLVKLAAKLDKGPLFSQKAIKNKTYIDLLFDRYRGQPLLSHFVIADMTELRSKTWFFDQCKKFEAESAFFLEHKKLIKKLCEDVLAELSFVNKRTLSDGKSFLAEVQKRHDVVKKFNFHESVTRRLPTDSGPFKLEWLNEWYAEIGDEVVGEYVKKLNAGQVDE
jgi:transcriptional regulator with XRE-family HTH domain